MASLVKKIVLTILLSTSCCNAFDLMDLFGLGLNPNHTNFLSSFWDTATELASDMAESTVDQFANDLVKNKFFQQYTEGLSNPELYYDFKQLVEVAGYEAEEHTVITDDGYVLTIYRIPGDGPPVFFQHGLMNSADDWVGGGIHSALPYSFLEDGYDVWFGNARGNKYSRNNVHISPVSPEFWDFSWHEIGVYDLPAMIDYVLKHTGKKNLTYVGHSQGTTSYLVMQSTKPEYNDKVNLGVMLSLVGYMTHVKSPLVRIIVPYTDIIYDIFKDLGIYEFPANNILTEMIQDIFCDSNPVTDLICTNLCFSSFGFDFQELNPERMPIFLSHAPSSGSTKQLVHYAQGIRSGHFRPFDQGRTLNQEIYGSSLPPEYALEKITSPLAIFYSNGDWFSNTTDVNKVMKKAPNVVDYFRVPSRNFNHQDYVWAKDSNRLQYPRIKSLLSKYGDKK